MRSLRLAPIPLLLSLAGCAPEGVKDDIAEPPFASMDEAVKADGALRPVDKGLLKVGGAASGTFSASEGWISHEIYLTAGEVDVFASGQEADASIPQDTIVYVFGPKHEKSGLFPRQALAFNDDEEPGVSVSSQARVKVPTDGTYRVVVSTYANWVWYPRNTARGTWTTTVKCPRAGAAEGACGPAVAPEGGACFADGECAPGLHCEGEIVCAPDTLCLYTRPGACVADYAWLTVSPRQCGMNPWQQEPQDGPGAEGLPEGELRDIARYFAAQGIAVEQLGFLDPAEPRATCLACQCPRGDTLLVKAPAAAAERLVAEHGFGRVRAGELAGVAPVQCGGNPWEAEGVAGATELERVVSWATGAGAGPLSAVGFVHHVELRAQCRACSCPRGDLLVAGGARDRALDPLASFGFGDLYTP
jgi:hypothetical protein